PQFPSGINVGAKPGEEVNHLPFRPAAIVAIGLGNKRTVSAIIHFAKSNVRIGLNLGPGLRRDPAKGIIGGMQDIGWHGYALNAASGRGTVVIVIGTGESAIRGGHLVVELTQAADVTFSNIEVLRKQPRLGTQAAA